MNCTVPLEANVGQHGFSTNYVFLTSILSVIIKLDSENLISRTQSTQEIKIWIIE